MKSIVINECHGGFGLSYEGVLHYALIKGLVLYPEKNRYGGWMYWVVPPKDRSDFLTGAEFLNASMDARRASNAAYERSSLSDRNIPRDDPALAQTVKELGKDAFGEFAALKIVEIPDDVEWEIAEYDGLEWVAEKHRVWS
jgi:hypothetical protein